MDIINLHKLDYETLRNNDLAFKVQLAPVEYTVRHAKAQIHYSLKNDELNHYYTDDPEESSRLHPGTEYLKHIGIHCSLTEKDKELRNVNKSYVAYRSDNGVALGTVKSKYIPYDNYKMLNTLKDLLEIGQKVKIDIHKCGTYNGGKKVFFFHKLPKETILKDDKVSYYLYALSSHDGSSRLQFGVSTEVLSCGNQFTMFLNNNAEFPNVKFKHTDSINKHIANDMSFKQLINTNANKISQMITRMAQTDITKKLVEDCIHYITNTDRVITANEKKILIDEGISGKVSGKKVKILKGIEEAYEKEIQQKGFNAWGLFNTVTRYCNDKDGYKRDNGKVEYLHDGYGNKLMQKSLNYILNNV